MTVEKATNKDLKDIIDLWEKISVTEFSDYIGKENVDYFIESGELENETKKWLSHTYISRQNNELAGFVVIIENLIELLIVAPQYQNRWIGKKLYNFALNRINKDYSKIQIECFENNTRINSICTRLGFNLDGEYLDEMGFVTKKYSIKTTANNV